MIFTQHHNQAPRLLHNRFLQNTPQTQEEAKSGWKNFQGKEELASHLKYVQKGLCAYCEARLDSALGYHLEHIQPKSAFPHLTFEYTNLVLSCIASENLTKNDPTLSCGHHKRSRFDASLFISPTLSGCQRYFSCNLLGEIEPASNLDERDWQKADYSIKLLNLNSLRLARQREQVIDKGFKIIAELQDDQEALENFLELEFAMINGFYCFPFINTRKEHFEMFLPTLPKGVSQ